MKDVEIYECDLIDNNKNKRGKIAILRGGLKASNPIAHMNNAVSIYVGRKPYNEYVDINMDNPWIRVIVSGINEIEFKKFNDQTL